MSKPVKGISLYDIVTSPQPSFDQTVLSPGDAAEIAMRKDFPKARDWPASAERPSWHCQIPSSRRDTPNIRFGSVFSG